MLISLLFPPPPSLMPSTSLLLVTFNLLQLQIHSSSKPSRICLKKPPYSLALLWPTGHLKMATCTTNITCIFPQQHACLYFTQYTPLFSLVISDDFAPKQLLSEASGGPAFPHLSTVLWPAVRSVNKTRFILTRVLPCLIPSSPLPPFCSNNSQLTLPPTSLSPMDMTP
jgi:hypothetical protein